MTTQDLIDYYKGLLILQYATQPNALATVDAVIKALVQDQIVSKVRDAFDLETAIGAQLDIVASYRGIPRVVFGVVPDEDWSLMEYSDADNSLYGWMEYSDADPFINWLEYNDLNGVPKSLTDTQMRRLIKLVAGLHSWDGGLGSLDRILFSTFGHYVNVVDNLNMSVVYQHQAIDPDTDGLWDVAILANVLPHPSGVAFTTVEV